MSSRSQERADTRGDPPHRLGLSARPVRRDRHWPPIGQVNASLYGRFHVPALPLHLQTGLVSEDITVRTAQEDRMQVDELLKPFPIKEFHPFPRALRGPGAHEMSGPEALKLGFKKTLIMTSGLRGTDIVHKIAESMKYHGVDTVIYDKVESNPKDYNVMDAVAMYQQNQCDSFVSIGGGSSHDACKGARISVAHDGRPC